MFRASEATSDLGYLLSRGRLSNSGVKKDVHFLVQ